MWMFGGSTLSVPYALDCTLEPSMEATIDKGKEREHDDDEENLDGYPPEIVGLLTTLRSQLTTQATVISSLATQRDLLAHTIEEERARWDGEREGWERSAEALIRRQPPGSNIDREELERRNGLLEGEVRGKTVKLNDALARLAALEHELSELKPLLLLPTAPPPPQTSTSKYYPSYVDPIPERPRTVNHYDRRATPAPASPKHKIDAYSADARIEHILLAARRLGRERVANMNSAPKKKSTARAKTSTHYREPKASTSRQAPRPAPSPRASSSRKTPLDRLVSAAAAMSQDEMNQNQPPKRRRISGGGGSMLDVLAAAAERREPTPRVIAPPTPSSSRVIRPFPPPFPPPAHSLTAALNAAAVTNNVKRRRKPQRDNPGPPPRTTGMVEFHLAAQTDGDHDAEGSDED